MNVVFIVSDFMSQCIIMHLNNLIFSTLTFSLQILAYINQKVALQFRFVHLCKMKSPIPSQAVFSPNSLEV